MLLCFCTDNALNRGGKTCLTSPPLLPSSNSQMADSVVASSGISWEELKSGIGEAFAGDRVNVDGVKRLMSSYVSNRCDWGRYENFDKHRLVWVRIEGSHTHTTKTWVPLLMNRGRWWGCGGGIVLHFPETPPTLPTLSFVFVRSLLFLLGVDSLHIIRSTTSHLLTIFI